METNKDLLCSLSYEERIKIAIELSLMDIGLFNPQAHHVIATTIESCNIKPEKTNNPKKKKKKKKNKKKKRRYKDILKEMMSPIKSDAEIKKVHEENLIKNLGGGRFKKVYKI